MLGLMSNQDTPSPLVRPAATASLIGVSLPTVYRWIANGTFPKPRRLGPNSVAFLRSEIEEWMADLRPSDAPPATEEASE